jgi:hypothetical protein
LNVWLNVAPFVMHAAVVAGPHDGLESNSPWSAVTLCGVPPSMCVQVTVSPTEIVIADG